MIGIVAKATIPFLFNNNPNEYFQMRRTNSVFQNLTLKIVCCMNIISYAANSRFHMNIICYQGK